MITWEQCALLFGAAVACGAINSVAGGGTFVSFPMLLLVGVPPIQANATNTVALVPGMLASAGAYRNELRGPEARRVLWPLLVTGCMGGVLGAVTLLVTPQHTFMRLIPFLLLAGTLLFAFSRKITAAIHIPHGEAALSTKGGAVAQLFVAFYIGYFGAGAGILLMALLALLGVEDIHRVNAYKTLQAAVCNGVAVVIFVSRGVVYWRQAGVMVMGALLGGYYGATLAQKMNPKHIRTIVIAVGLSMACYFFLRH